MTLALEASIAEFRYPRATGPALHSVDLKVHQGEFVVITGPAGSGKTTLCYCLAGVIPHFTSGLYEGAVRVKGRNLNELRLPEIAGLVGFVFQRPENQLFNLTVEEDVAFGPENLCLAPNDIRGRLRKALSSVGMGGFAKRQSGSLSGGETQRIVLSSILSMDPDILVLDQPAAALDPLGRAKVYENICRLNADLGKTIILVEDRLAELLPFVSRLVLLDRGEMVRDASPAEFFAAGGLSAYGIRVPDNLDRSYPSAGWRPSPRPIPINPQVVPQSLPASRPRTSSAAQESDAIPQASGSEASAAALQVRKLCFRYPKSGTWALKDISLNIHGGEFVAILGENGAGKTTLAKHFAGLLRATEGQVTVCGQDVAKMSAARLSDRVGYLFQDPDYQIFCSSVFDEVAFSLKIRKVPQPQIAARVDAMLDRLGLLAVRDAHPYLLCSGQRQRLALASILVHCPQVLMVDEPTTGLDRRETTQVMEVLEDFVSRGGTVVMITHDTELARDHAGRVITMVNGAIDHDGAAAQIPEAPPLERRPSGRPIRPHWLHQLHS